MSQSYELPPERYNILCVSDGLMASNIVAKLVKYLGYNAVIAYYDENILEKVEQLLPNLVILELFNLTHLDVCSQLKSNDRTKDIPLVVLSRTELKDKVMELRADECLIAPVSVEELKDCIRAYLQKSSGSI